MAHLGIDYGSKLAGTTVICFEKNSQLHFLQSEKKQDADIFLRKNILELKPSKIFMDAQLSLQGVYQKNGDDYFYLKCDREVNAMSPMFLGGLTARAMKIRASFPEIPFYEIYPAHLVRILFSDNPFYKKDLNSFSQILESQLPVGLSAHPCNWHQVDAVLAWFSGWRFKNNTAIIFGEENEGIICV